MKKVLIIFFLLFTELSFSQEKTKIGEDDYTNNKVEMADKFREDGKIYVVIAVILVILGGMFYYLVSIDKKVSKLEKELNN